MNKYIIAESDSFISKIESRKFKAIYKKIKEYIYPQLVDNPFYGPNIKKLKGKYKEIYRYRTGNYRLFYKIEQKKIIVFVVDIYFRKDSYKK